MAAWDRALFGVVPSVGAETFGNVVTEAMSRGRAVVASRLGGIVDIIEDGRSGLLVPANDDAALASAMQDLIDDAALRARLGAAARRRVALFAASRVLPRFEALYRELLAGRTAGSA
jgi:glycosyltransferase involved in cell wall biosynthesis